MATTKYVKTLENDRYTNGARSLSGMANRGSGAYQRPRPINEDRPESPERARALSPRTSRLTITRLLNHARSVPILDEELLSCPTCKLFPLQPVTGLCGHTRCTECIKKRPKCPCRVRHPSWLMQVNVVVQDVLEKLMLTEPELRLWRLEQPDLPERPEHQEQQEQPFMMEGPPPPPAQFADEQVAGGSAPAAEEAGLDMEQDGAWSLPEAEYRRRRRVDKLKKTRKPIKSEERLLYGAFLMENNRYLEAVPHLIRGTLDGHVAALGRHLLRHALVELTRDRPLADVEAQLCQGLTAQAASNWLPRCDLECVFCVDVFCRPVTTPCGHTFCRTCLERSLDYRPTCPLCMQSLEIFQFHRAGTNQFLTTTLQCMGIERNPPTLNRHVIPILACTVAFPGMPCPLFLFDPRYWYMIRRILESNSRTFGLVAYEREGTHSQYGTILEIRDCVHLQDGCTIVSTVGVSRFRVIERSVWDGWCDVARVETVTDIPVEDEETVAQLQHLAHTVAYKAAVWIASIGPELRAKIETAFGSVPCLDTRGCWWTQPDGPAWLWWLISILPLKLEIKILILATDSLLKRMRAVLRTLDTSLAQPPHGVREYESALADWWIQRHL